MRLTIGVIIVLSVLFVGAFAVVRYHLNTPDATDEIEEALTRHAERSDYAVVPPVENFKIEGRRVQGANIYYSNDLERAKEHARSIGVKEVINLKDRENPIPVE